MTGPERVGLFADDERPIAARAGRLQAAVGAVTEGRGAPAEVTRLLSPVASRRWRGWALDEWTRELIAPNGRRVALDVCCTSASGLAFAVMDMVCVWGVPRDDVYGLVVAVYDVLDRSVGDGDTVADWAAACAHGVRTREDTSTRSPS